MEQKRYMREVYYVDGSTVRKKYVYENAAPDMQRRWQLQMNR